MAIKIITDSASDITQQQAALMDITVIPMKTVFDDAEYLDGIDITYEEFYKKLTSSKNLPTTTQISPAEFVEMFRSQLGEKDDLIYIGMSGALSGTIASAELAVKMMEKDERKHIYVVDSINVTVGERLIVEYALRLRSQGLSARKIVKALEKRRGDVRLVATLDTLEYLKKGGRISTAVALAGTLLSIKPLIGIVRGRVAMLGKARGLKNARKTMDELIEKDGGIDAGMPYCLAYTGTDDALLRKFVSTTAQLHSCDINLLPVSMVGSVIGTHIGPNAFCIAYFAGNAAA